MLGTRKRPQVELPETCALEANLTNALPILSPLGGFRFNVRLVENQALIRDPYPDLKNCSIQRASTDYIERRVACGASFRRVRVFGGPTLLFGQLVHDSEVVFVEMPWQTVAEMEIDPQKILTILLVVPDELDLLLQVPQLYA